MCQMCTYKPISGAYIKRCIVTLDKIITPDTGYKADCLDAMIANAPRSISIEK